MLFSLGLAFYGLTDECESSRRFYLEPFQHCAARRELTMPPTQAARLSHNDSLSAWKLRAMLTFLPFRNIYISFILKTFD